VVVHCYSKATRHNGQLEFALNACKAALPAVEAEANVARAQLAKSDARVADKIFNIPASFDAPILPIF
jgi:hypothetical protein